MYEETVHAASRARTCAHRFQCLGAEHSRVWHDRQGHDMDPASAYDFHTWEIFQNVSSGLMAYTPGTTNLVPALATGYTVNAKGDEYTFKLRKGVKFSNGTPFTAAAVKWSIDRVAKLNGDPAALVTQYVKSVDIVDDYTVKFVLNGPVSYLPALVATPTYFPMDPSVYPADKIVK